MNADPRIGSVLDGKYELLRVIGEGGMGRVYEGRHRTTTRRVAVKFVSSRHESSAHVLQRFEREARAAGGLEHPGIAAVYDFGQAPDGRSYLVLEFLEGENCQKLLQREGALPVPRALNIVRQVCDGLTAAAEAGIVHRDLKPANLFVCKRKHGDAAEVVKILDFGVAKLDQPDAHGDDTPSGTTLGTPQYMSPEQARGAKDLDHRSDLYALGAILYELLSGKKPHAGDSPLEILFNVLHHPPTSLAALRPELPKGLIAVIERAMDPDLERRFQSAAALKEALVEFGWAEPLASAPPAGNGGAAPDTLAAGATDSAAIAQRPEAEEPASAPTFVPVASSRPAPGVALKPLVRTLILALVAIAAGGLGGWLTGRRAPPGKEPEQVQASGAVSVSVAPAHPVASNGLARGVALAPEGPARAVASAGPSSPARAFESKRFVAPRPPVGAPPTVTPAPAPAESSTPASQPQPQLQPRGTLWKADDGWLDQQK